MGLAGFITRNIMLGCLAIITIKWMLHFVVTTLTMGIKGKVTMKQMKWELFSKHESIGNLSSVSEDLSGKGECVTWRREWKNKTATLRPCPRLSRTPRVASAQSTRRSLGTIRYQEVIFLLLICVYQGYQSYSNKKIIFWGKC